jgi:hypothetical protein
LRLNNTEKKKVARPVKPIDWKLAEELMEAGCPGTEIASHFDMHPDTLYRRVEEEYGMGFTAFCSSKKATGESNIRLAQYRKAVKKQDNTMLIWLGKNRLGQKESQVDAYVHSDLEEKYMLMMNQLGSLQNAKTQQMQTPSDFPAIPPT